MLPAPLSAAALARLDPVVQAWLEGDEPEPKSLVVALERGVGADDLAFFQRFDPGTRPGFSVMYVNLDRAQLRELAEHPKVSWVNLPGTSEPF